MSLLPRISLHRCYYLVAEKIDEIKSSCLLCFFFTSGKILLHEEVSWLIENCAPELPELLEIPDLFLCACLYTLVVCFCLFSLISPRATREIFFVDGHFIPYLIAFVRCSFSPMEFDTYSLWPLVFLWLNQRYESYGLLMLILPQNVELAYSPFVSLEIICSSPTSLF